MPDNQDYSELRRLLASPGSWSADDAATARSLLRSQEHAVAAVHPFDSRRREAMQAVADDLRAALSTWEQASG